MKAKTAYSLSTGLRKASFVLLATLVGIGGALLTGGISLTQVQENPLAAATVLLPAAMELGRNWYKKQVVDKGAAKSLLILLFLPVVFYGCITWTDAAGRTHKTIDWEEVTRVATVYGPLVRDAVLEGIDAAREAEDKIQERDIAVSADKRKRTVFVGAVVAGSLVYAQGQDLPRALLAADTVWHVFQYPGSFEDFAEEFFSAPEPVPSNAQLFLDVIRFRLDPLKGA